jgi:hypothetical protein
LLINTPFPHPVAPKIPILLFLLKSIFFNPRDGFFNSSIFFIIPIGAISIVSENLSSSKSSKFHKNSMNSLEFLISSVVISSFFIRERTKKKYKDKDKDKDKAIEFIFILTFFEYLLLGEFL